MVVLIVFGILIGISFKLLEGEVLGTLMGVLFDILYIFIVVEYL